MMHSWKKKKVLLFGLLLVHLYLILFLFSGFQSFVLSQFRGRFPCPVDGTLGIIKENDFSGIKQMAVALFSSLCLLDVD